MRDALGPDGCSALLGRALAECEPKHPVLRQMRGPDQREIQLDGMAAAIEQYGIDAAEAGIDALFTSLAGILGRLIGDDMTRRLLDAEPGQSGAHQETL